MRQFVLPPNYDGGGRIKISGADSRYILNVLRLSEGDSFPAVDHAGNRFILRITETASSHFTADCTTSDRDASARDASDDTADATALRPDIILLQCLPKGKKLEMIVRQAVESGAEMIIPIESAHSVAVIKDERSGKKTERLRKIAEEAVQQSGNRGVPEILEAVKMSALPDLLDKNGISGLKLFFHQQRLEKGTLHEYLSRPSKSICIMIGPEGGFSDDETDFLLARDFHPVYLGKNVLRTETAAIYALGAVNTILLEKNEWKTDTRK